MSEDIERVLLVLAERNSLQNGVTVSFLSNCLGLDRGRLEKIIELLLRSGYIQVQQLDRVALIRPTLAGYEKAAALRRQKQAQPETRSTSPLIYAAAAGLLVIFVGFLGWWFGLFSLADSTQSGAGDPAPSVTSGPSRASASLGLPAVNEPLPTETLIILPTVTPTTVPTPTPAPAPANTTATATEEGPGPLPTAIPLNATQSGAIPTPVPLVEQPAETINIVLMGTDTTEGSWRTDTLIVVSVDPNLPSVSMLSIPRDLYVYVPGWQMQRINTADFHGERVGYPGGGPGLVKATIEYNLGIRVHYYARVDFQGFVEILETLDGVDVVVDCELHDTFPDPEAPGGSSDIDLAPGVHHLEGKQALWYARSRWNTSDFDRGRRQQRVLRGAFAKAKQLGLLPKAPELWDEGTQTVETDVPLETALWLAQIGSRLGSDTALKSRFIDNTVVENWRTAEGAAVLKPSYDRVGPLVSEAVAPPDTARARQGVARVEVLNGTTWPNWAYLAADRLLWEGFDVVNVQQADRTDYQQTTVIDFNKTEKGSPVSHLAGVMSVDETRVVVADTPLDDVDFRVFVGYDYDPCYKSYWRAVHGTTATQ